MNSSERAPRVNSSYVATFFYFSFLSSSAQASVGFRHPRQLREVPFGKGLLTSNIAPFPAIGRAI